jgi:hypothetical protein
MSCVLNNMLAMWYPVNMPCYGNLVWSYTYITHVELLHGLFFSYAICVKLYDKICQIDHGVTLVLIVTVNKEGRINCAIG